MKPMPFSGHSHPGLVYMQNFRVFEEGTNLLFNSHKTPGTLGNCIDHGSCAWAAVEEVAEEFSNPVIGEKLINAEIDHECFQVRAVLHWVLDILWKCCMCDHAAVWTSFAFDTVLCNNDLQWRKVMDLPPFDRCGFF